MTGAEEVINNLGALSYGGIWIVSFLANIVIPIPEEIVLLSLGYLSGTGAINGWLVIPISFSALMLNDYILYYLSKRGSRLTSWLYKTFFEKRLEKRGDAWLQNNLGTIVFFSRFLIQFRFIGPFLAGTKKMSTNKFLLYNAVALAIYTPLFIGLGWYFHNKIIRVVDEVGVIRNIILIIASMALAIFVTRIAYKKIFKKS